MADIVYLSVIVAFFALALLLVRGCERIIGSDEAGVSRVEPARAPKEDLAA